MSQLLEELNTVTNFKSDAIDQIIEEILREPYAQENLFLETSIDTIAGMLEAEQVRFENKTSQINLEEQESFLRVKEKYCLLLMELDGKQINYLPQDTLAELRNNPTRTVHFMADNFRPEITKSKKLAKLRSEMAQSWVAFEEGLPQFAAETASWGNNQGFLLKLRGLALGYALESEALETLRVAVASFWEHKKAAIDEKLYRDSQNQAQLKPEIEKWIQDLGKQYPEWVFEGKVSRSSILRSLKFCLNLENLDQPVLTLGDLGTLLLLFGAAKRHSINLSGITPIEITELALKLLRAQRVRQRTLASLLPVTIEHVNILANDRDRILELLGKVD